MAKAKAAKAPKGDKTVKKPAKSGKKSPATAALDNPINPAGTGPVWGTHANVISARKRLRELLAGVDPAAMLDELTRLHSERSMRTLKAATVLSDSQNKLIEATLENAAHRSRCAEVKLQAFKVMFQCERLLESARNFVQQSHAQALKEAGGTVAERRALIDIPFVGELEQLGAVEHVIKAADIIIEDLDKSAWSLRAIGDAINMNLKEKR